MFGKKSLWHIDKITKKIQDDWLANEQLFVLFSKQLPFNPDKNQIIYVDNGQDVKIRKYIESHYDSISAQMRLYRYEFVYLPLLAKNGMDADSLNYMFPYRNTTENLEFPAEFNYDYLRKYLVEGDFYGSALLHYNRVNPCALDDSDKTPEEKARYEWELQVGLAQEVPNEWHENYYFSYRSIPDSSTKYLDAFFNFYVGNTSNGYLGGANIFAHPKHVDHGEDTSDYFFETASDDLIKEIKDRITILRKRGIHEFQLRELLEETPTLSRMVITQDFRIFLPDYNNREIIMTPLPKAVFLLFLRHPEGILFKKMRDYRDELLYIYRQLTRSLNDETVLKSIEDVTDPTNNSINEKCARIKEAFLREFDEFYAKYYFITGKRGEPKRIMLPQDKISWEVNLD